MLLLLFLASASAVDWYQQKDLSDYHLQSVISRDCYRGTYGNLALFTCPLTHVYLEPFASSSQLLCVVEASDHSAAAKILSLKGEVDVLWSDNQEYFIIANRYAPWEYPSICSRSEFEGAARNVYTVSSRSINPYTSTPDEVGAPMDSVAGFIGDVQENEIKQINERLAFGYPAGAWDTRNSYSPGAKLAVNYVIDEFSKSGATVTRHTFRTDMCDNVIAEFRGNVSPTEIVVLGAHLDSRSTNNTSPTQVAPGADDNGSGSALAILFARIVYNRKTQFRRTIRVITFCGEEQGLLGSRAIAQKYRTEGQNIIAMYNIDMVGYKPPTSGTVVAFMSGSQTQSLQNECRTTVGQYLNQALGTTSACCSDQQAFYENNFPAIGVFETNTSSVIYPDYHRSTDTPDKVNFAQVAIFGQAVFSCLLTKAQIM